MSLTSDTIDSSMKSQKCSMCLNRICKGDVHKKCLLHRKCISRSTLSWNPVGCRECKKMGAASTSVENAFALAVTKDVCQWIDNSKTMDSYSRKDLRLSISSSDVDDELDEADSPATTKRKYSVEYGGFYAKRQKLERVESHRLSNASDASSHGRASSTDCTGSDGEASIFGIRTGTTQNDTLSDTGNSSEDEEAPAFQGLGNKAQEMMLRMGYKEGKGLGKHQQGIVAPVEASRQRGRRGLGFSIEGLEPMDNLTWDKSKEHIVVQEEVLWLPQNDDEEPLCFELLSSWTQDGHKKKDISDETKFCHPQVLQEIIQSKTVFDNLSEKELYKGRSRSNPFETISKLFFQNRAALKMANMDAVFDFMFSQPVDENGASLVGPDEILYFADVCAAPGGFSEYILWKRKEVSNGFCDAKGFGFTLKENDFKLHDFFAAPSEFFEPHYGISGQLGDGDIYVPDNITNFRKFVLKCTGGKGVHFMMADGGFSVEGEENIQEILSKQLYLCQFLVALGIVRAGGHFVCKLFDIFTPFSVGLIYIMYKCFRKVCIHKPNSSRPANSERYIICKWRKEDIGDCFEYLYEINLRLQGFSREKSDEDVTELVSLDVIREDEGFFHYICESNNFLGERQVIGLQKIRAFCQDLTLFEDQQQTIRSESLKFWHLPDRSRLAPVRMEALEKAKSLVTLDLLIMSEEESSDAGEGTTRSREETVEKLSTFPSDLTVDNFEEKLRSPYDFRFVMLASLKDTLKDRGFFISLSGSNIYIWNGKENLKWVRCEIRFELPPDTLVYGEIVCEMRGEMKAQRKVSSFHMIDALVLNGFDVTKMHVVERHCYLKKFADALNKEGRTDLAPIRCKKLFKLEDIDSVLQPPLLSRKIMKGGGNMYKRVYCESEPTADEQARYTVSSGVFFLKITEEPWMMAYSKSQKRKYWFNTQDRKSTFECLKEVIAPINTSYSQGAIWWWDYGVRILESDETERGKLHLDRFSRHINKSR